MGRTQEAACRQSSQSYEELEAVAQFEFGFAVEAGSEDERQLDDLRAMVDQLEQECALEGIAARGQAIEVETGAAEQFGWKASVTGGAVADRTDPPAEADEEAAGAAESAAKRAELWCGGAGEEAGTHDQPVFAFGARPYKVREQGGIVLAVGVHFEEEGGAKMVERVGHAAFISISDAAFFAGEQVQVEMERHGLANDFGGAVGRIVINDEDVEIVRGNVRGLREDARKHDLKIAALVVSGENEAGNGTRGLAWGRHWVQFTA